MNKLLTLMLAAAIMCGMGCAKRVPKQWQASGGSRADATVEVGYIYRPDVEIPEASDSQAMAEATRRCKAWGYMLAEPFGLVRTQCQQMIPLPFGGMTCVSMIVTRQYQCLGRGDSPATDPRHVETGNN